MPVARAYRYGKDGIKLDHQFWINSVSSSLKRFKLYENQATELAGEAFNIASPKQVGEVLFG